MYRWMEYSTMGISHRTTFPSPRHIWYLIEPHMCMTETVRGPPDHSPFSLTDNVREALSLPYLQGRKLQPSLAGQIYHPLMDFGDNDRRGPFTSMYRLDYRHLASYFIKVTYALPCSHNSGTIAVIRTYLLSDRFYNLPGII